MFGFFRRMMGKRVIDLTPDVASADPGVTVAASAEEAPATPAPDAVPGVAVPFVAADVVAVAPATLDWVSVHRILPDAGGGDSILVRAHYTVQDADGDNVGKDVQVVGGKAGALALKFLGDVETLVHDARVARAQKIANGVQNP